MNIKTLLRKFGIKWRAFKIKYIKNQRYKGGIDGAALWDIYNKEIPKMKASIKRRAGRRR